MRRLLTPTSAVLLILVITAAWWALALWPLPAEAPAWIEQARLMCFGASRDTLPSAAGWLLLAGEPLAMLSLLAIVWPTARRPALAAGAVAVMAGSAAVALRVTAAQGLPFDPNAAAPALRLEHHAAPFALVDQRGDTVTLEQFRGRPLIVAFAYAHCATVCPVIVAEAKAAHQALPGSTLVIITLDPWRDTPSRLPAIAASWQLGEHQHVLSGPAGVVEAVIRAWRYPVARDTTTGEVTHATYAHVVAGDGGLWQVTGRADAIIALVRSL